MSLIINNSDAAKHIFQQFSTENIKALEGAPRVWPAFGMEIPSSSRSTLHTFLASSAAFVREWKDTRALNEMGALAFEVINRHWELSWKFHENQIRDDLSGLTAMALMEARNMAKKWAEAEDKLVADTVQAGKTKSCYDGQSFFSASHPTDPLGIASGTFSNLLTASPLTHANLITALQTMRAYKLPDGSPWVGPNTAIKLIVDATNLETARQITSQWISPTASYGVAAASAPSMNVLQGAVEVLYNGWFNGEAGVWYLAAESAGMKPVIFQRRQGVEAQEVGPGSEMYFQRKEYHIGQDARYEAAFSHPQLMLRVEPT